MPMTSCHVELTAEIERFSVQQEDVVALPLMVWEKATKICMSFGGSVIHLLSDAFVANIVNVSNLVFFF